MNITNKTILITGGGSGIGLEIAKQLTSTGNKVIITGRTEAKLTQAAEGLKNISIFVADINKAEDVSKLITYLIDNGGRRRCDQQRGTGKFKQGGYRRRKFSKGRRRRDTDKLPCRN